VFPYQPNPDKRLERSDSKNPILSGKLQISNTKQITMTEIQNSKHAQDIEKRTYQYCFGD
jgi:hypothetical protein